MTKKRRGLGRRLEDILDNPNKASLTEKYFNTYFPKEDFPEFYDEPEPGYEPDEDLSAGAEEPKIEKEPEPIPPPSEIYTVDQAVGGGGAFPYRRATARPDLYEGFYGEGPSRSTRVQAYQWIPTTMVDPGPDIDLDSDGYQKAMLYGYDATKNDSLYGDLLVAFARPSKTQETLPQGSLYVYRDNPESVWNMFKKSNSLGRAIKLLSGGNPYVDSDGERYKDIHKDTIDPETDEPWAMWIFDDYWGLRANNESPDYRSEVGKKVRAGKRNF